MRTTPVGNRFRHVILAFGLFLAFGSGMAALAGTMLIWPGTALDKLWSLNQTAHAELGGKAGSFIGALFWALTMTLIGTAVGWFKQRVWAFYLTVAIFCTQVAGDVVNLARGDFLRGGVGIVIAGALVLYLLRSNIRKAFQ